MNFLTEEGCVACTKKVLGICSNMLSMGDKSFVCDSHFHLDQKQVSFSWL